MAMFYSSKFNAYWQHICISKDTKIVSLRTCLSSFWYIPLPKAWWALLPTLRGRPWYSDSALDYWSTGRAIDPAPGAWFITKFISLTQVVPAQFSLTVQNRGLRRQSFHYYQPSTDTCLKLTPPTSLTMISYWLICEKETTCHLSVYWSLYWLALLLSITRLWGWAGTGRVQIQDSHLLML